MLWKQSYLLSFPHQNKAWDLSQSKSRYTFSPQMRTNVKCHEFILTNLEGQKFLFKINFDDNIDMDMTI